MKQTERALLLVLLFLLSGCSLTSGPAKSAPDGGALQPWQSDTAEFDGAGPAADTQDGALPDEIVPDIPYQPPIGFEMDFIDVGQGDSILLRFPQGSTMLVDGGGKGAGWSVVVPYLQDLNLDYLDYLVVTHPDADHCGGLDDVVWEIEIGEAWENGQTNDTWAWWDFSDALDELEVPRRIVQRGDEEIIDGCEVEVFNGDEGWDDTNGNSIVLSIECQGIVLLLTGDAHAGTQEELTDEYPQGINSDVVKIPHHGSADRYTHFPSYVRPDIAVCSVGANGYGHPDPQVIQEWEDAGATFYRTDKAGTVVVTALAGELSVVTEW